MSKAEEKFQFPSCLRVYKAMKTKLIVILEFLYFLVVK